MTDEQTWKTGGLDAAAYAALAEGLPASGLWSLLLDILGRRAGQRTPADLLQQWNRDGFTRLAAVDQRTFNALDGHLLAAAESFEAVELSPLAPLGACSVMGLGSQNRIVSALRGTEVVADPTNVLALECARRLREHPALVVRLATSHRCVRTQPFPKRRAFAAHFRLFCLATAGHEQKDQRFVTDALTEHITTHLGALDRLERHGYHFPHRQLRVLATPARAALADRIAASISGVAIERAALEQRYYDGLRFMISVRTAEDEDMPLIDGGAFNWLGALTANRKMVFVASAIGTQAAAVLFGQPTAATTPGAQ